jgi:hypothetical protein
LTLRTDPLFNLLLPLCRKLKCKPAALFGKNLFKNTFVER